jgi:putative FmdB family regulatory protein
MPIYEYIPLAGKGCDYCLNGFDQLQKISADPLQHCPRCGAKIRRIISAPSLPKSGPSLEPSNLEKHGFTQYRKSSKGEYYKTAGTGPNVITDD